MNGRRDIIGLRPVKRKTKMFDLVQRTWNPIVGCEHCCVYCWSRFFAETRLRHTLRYRGGFKPQLIEAELGKRFHNGYLVFVSDMGDMFGSWVPSSWIRKVLQTIKESSAQFLLLTKNPSRFHEFLNEFPPNVVLGATIESNRDYKVSKAPSPRQRYLAMKDLNWQPKMVSVEPILNFDRDIFLEWIRGINPQLVYVGYDNYYNFTHHRLAEPSQEKTKWLINELEEFTSVRRKSLREGHRKAS